MIPSICRTQGGLLSLFYSVKRALTFRSQGVGPTPVGTIELIEEAEEDGVASPVLELTSDDVRQTYISCPRGASRTLGIKKPMLGLVIKYIDRYLTLEVAVQDHLGCEKFIRVSNFEIKAKRHDSIATLPLQLQDGWNLVQLDLRDLTFRAFGTKYAETNRVTIHANCRLRRVYFTDQPQAEDSFPPEFRLYQRVSV
ncbi:hypothetical protein IWQ60_008161 [Tieghemiomyces parasiticus]|uniref:CFA20 domain-containing protein n=1 Tax=Tieghemiomyces parasiticus TaxID=78921 RepID=A0A9W8A010_9FUNG|nr:hypothetical protein IWQ60_008161 [Tieghemiomyces parasiticus]